MTCVCFWQSFLGFGSSAEIAIELADLDKRKKVDLKNEEGKKEKLPLYLDGESVTGKVRIFPCYDIIMTSLCLHIGTYQSEREEVGTSRNKSGVCRTD